MDEKAQLHSWKGGSVDAGFSGKEVSSFLPFLGGLGNIVLKRMGTFVLRCITQVRREKTYYRSKGHRYERSDRTLLGAPGQ